MGWVWGCQLGDQTQHIPLAMFPSCGHTTSKEAETGLVMRRFAKKLIPGLHQFNKVKKIKHDWEHEWMAYENADGRGKEWTWEICFLVFSHNADFFLCQLPFMSEEIIGTLVNPPGAQRPFVQSEEINHKCFGENGRRAHVFSIMHKLGMK